MPARRRRWVDSTAFGLETFSVPAVLDQRAEQWGDRMMMSIGGTAVTFAQMRDRSCAAAGVLAEHGVGRGDTVALFTGTCPEWVYFWLGAARIGAVTAAVNAASKADFLTHALHVSKTKLVVVDAERQQRLADPGVKSLLTEHVSLTGTHAEPPSPGSTGDVGALFFTSGTTGPSKAVATSWHYLFTAAATVGSAWEFGPDDVLWTAMPLFHLSAAPTVLVPLLVGSSTVLATGFHPARVWDDIRSCGATGFAGAGAMVSMLWNQPPDPRDATLPLRFISAAPISADLHRQAEQRYGCRIVTMYGLTEAFPIAYTSVSDDGIPGTSGRVNPAFEVRIVDGEGSR